MGGYEIFKAPFKIKKIIYCIYIASLDLRRKIQLSNGVSAFWGGRGEGLVQIPQTGARQINVYETSSFLFCFFFFNGFGRREVMFINYWGKMAHFFLAQSPMLIYNFSSESSELFNFNSFFFFFNVWIKTKKNLQQFFDIFL